MTEGRGSADGAHRTGRQLHLRRARRPHQPGGQRAARARRPAARARAPRAGRLGRVRRHVVRGAEDRRRDRRGVHVPAAQGLRVLPRLHRGRGGGRRRRHARPDARGVGSEPRAPDAAGGRRRDQRRCARARCPSTRWSRASPAISTPAPIGAGRHRHLEVHHREHRASRRRACTRRAARWSAIDGYARGVLDIRADDVVLPVPKLFFGYARDLAALFPFGVGATGVIFAEQDDARARSSS